jgi:hypothetical protein
MALFVLKPTSGDWLLFGLPVWLFIPVFAIVMILVGVLVWYLEKLVWYLVGRGQESEFDKVKETEALVGCPRIPVGQPLPVNRLEVPRVPNDYFRPVLSLGLDSRSVGWGLSDQNLVGVRSLGELERPSESWCLSS